MKHMKQSEKKIKNEIIKSTQSIKKKYRDLHKERFINEEHFREQFKPIIDPIHRFIDSKEQLLGIDTNLNSEDAEQVQEIQTEEPGIFDKNTPSSHIRSFDTGIDNQIFHSSTSNKRPTSLKSFDDSAVDHKIYRASTTSKSPTSLKSLDDCAKILNTRQHDKRFGIRKLTNGYMLGQTAVKLNDDKIYVKNKNFKLSDGLRNLLFLTQPKKYTDNDLKVYKDILLLTDTNKISLDNISDYKKIKYKEIIQPLFKSGNGIQTEYMVLNKKNDDSKYTYWDDPNELIERLRLLVSSNSAGHNAHNNEILSIIEELKEANIIY